MSRGQLDTALAAEINKRKEKSYTDIAGAVSEEPITYDAVLEASLIR